MKIIAHDEDYPQAPSVTCTVPARLDTPIRELLEDGDIDLILEFLYGIDEDEAENLCEFISTVEGMSLPVVEDLASPDAWKGGYDER